LTSGRLKTPWPAARSKSGNAINIAYKKPCQSPFLQSFIYYFGLQSQLDVLKMSSIGAGVSYVQR